MDSDRIKSAVNKIKYIKSTGDLAFERPETKTVGTNLLIELVVHFEKAPTFVAAIYQHMVDAGINITTLKGDALAEFSRLYGSRISRLNEGQIKSLRKISDKLFANI